MQSEQTCKNCGHFVRHYRFGADTGFVPLDTGTAACAACRRRRSAA